MSDILTFDRLPNEIIVCIFAYLSSADNFCSFFDLNDRLRKLMKRYVTYSRRALQNDIQRFSTLHSWYKHLDFVDDGETFYLIPCKGEQERYSFNPRVSDFLGIHWHFYQSEPVPIGDQRVQQIIHEHPIKLNPCFHPSGPSKGPLTEGFQDFVRRYYTPQSDTLEIAVFSRSYGTRSELAQFLTDDVHIHLGYIYENERKRLNNTITEAAQHIWKELQELEDVNLLEINYGQ